MIPGKILFVFSVVFSFPQYVGRQRAGFDQTWS